MQERVWHLFGDRQRNPGVQPEHIHMLDLETTGSGQRQHLDDGRPCELGLLLVADAGVRDGGDRARELARRRLGRAPHVRGRQLAKPRERAQPVDDVGLRREQLLAAEPSRSINRWTYRSGRAVSIAASDER